MRHTVIVTRQLGVVKRADGTVEDITYAVHRCDRHGERWVDDIRTSDGEPLTLGHMDLARIFFDLP